jgi:hypothetical protein
VEVLAQFAGFGTEFISIIDGHPRNGEPKAKFVIRFAY